MNDASAREAQAGPAAAGAIPLREKFFGCIVGSHIGAAMGAVTQNWPYDRIEKEYGTLDKLLGYQKGWQREPGTTEDGVERAKLIITAIIEKQDRVTAEDVKRIWVRDVKPEAATMILEPYEAMLVAAARSGIPARNLGQYCDYSGLNSVAGSCQAIGLINAGDVKGAIDDINEVGLLYQANNSRGILWGTVTAVAIAAAAEPGATVDSVLAAISQNCRGAAGELQRSLKAAAGCKDFRDLRKAFDTIYSSQGPPYASSYAPEVVSKGVCIFRMVKGNVKDAIIAGANMGRDTASVAAISGGLSGALSGPSSIPEEWIKQIDRATGVNKYTNNPRTLREHADGLHKAFQARLGRLKSYCDKMATA